MNAYTLTLTQEDLRLIVDSLRLRASREMASVEALTSSQFADSRRTLEKTAAACDQLASALHYPAYSDHPAYSDEGASA